MKAKARIYLPLIALAILPLFCPTGSAASSVGSSQRSFVEVSPRGNTPATLPRSGALEGGAGLSRRGEAAPAAGRQMPREGGSGESGRTAGARPSASSVVPKKAGKLSAGDMTNAKKKLSGAGRGAVKDVKTNMAKPGQIQDVKKAFEAGPKSDAFGFGGSKMDDKGLLGMEGMKDMKGMPGGPGDMGGKALGKEAFGGDKDGKFDPLGQSGSGGYGKGLGNKEGKKSGRDGLFGKKDDKGMGNGSGQGGKKDTTGSFGKGSGGKKDSAGKKDTSTGKQNDSGKKDTSESKKDDSGKGSDTGDDSKDKEEKEKSSGGGIGPDPGVDSQEGGNNDPLGFNPQNRNRERGNAPDTGAVGVNSGEGDRSGAGNSNVDTGASIDARVHPGMTDDQHQVHQEGMSQLEQLGTYGVDPADTGMHEGMRSAPPR